MRDTLWAMVVLVAGIVGFLIGYAVPPLLEAGMIGGAASRAEAPELSAEMQRYYGALHEEEEEE